MSGLPESFKKQIAKTTAGREAYSQTCASFQTVVHVQQRAAGKIQGFIILLVTYFKSQVYIGLRLFYSKFNIYRNFYFLIRLLYLEPPVAYKSLPDVFNGVL